MNVYNLPENPKAFIFDIDCTLYTNDFWGNEQVDCQIRHFSDLRGISHDEGRKMIGDFRKNWEKEHGHKISLGNTLTHFGISIEESIRWRTELHHPENFLKKDHKLASTLEIIASNNIKMCCVTNNPVVIAKRTLEAIGVDEILKDIVGLDTCGKSKPAFEPFELAAKILKTTPKSIVAVGDRFDIDLDFPLQMGMGGILVSGVEDVYSLAKIFNLG